MQNRQVYIDVVTSTCWCKPHLRFLLAKKENVNCGGYFPLLLLCKIPFYRKRKETQISATTNIQRIGHKTSHSNNEHQTDNEWNQSWNLEEREGLMWWLRSCRERQKSRKTTYTLEIINTNRILVLQVSHGYTYRQKKGKSNPGSNLLFLIVI